MSRVADNAIEDRDTVTTGAIRDRRIVKKGALIGLVSGLVAISCCISPVVLVTLGVVTGAGAVTLGNTLYYTYGWLFRGAGLLVASVAVVLYLRRRGYCNLKGAYSYRAMLLTLVISGGATYTALFWLTKYLGEWFG